MDTIPFTFPEGWIVHEFRYPYDVAHPHAKLRAWLADNLEGRWMIRHKGYRVRVAFENDFDAMTFVLADGEHQAFRT